MNLFSAGGRTPDSGTAETFRPPVSRRSLLRGAVLGAGAVAAGPLLSACGGSKSSSGSGSKTVTFGSNAAVPQPKGAYESLFAAATKATGLTVKPNWVDHNTFQQNISSYLQGNPDDVFNWFAGERMQFFAGQGLVSNVDDVWTKIGGSYTDAMKAQSKGKDGHYYLVPFDYYPWAVFYSKSLWKAKGYQQPTSWDDYITLAKKMRTDGIIPIAFTDKDGWPAMGTFDILNMRINGYQYHINLMAGKEGWDTARTKAVFKQWAELLPYYSKGALGLTWQDGATQLENKQAGMFLLGGFVVSNFKPANQGDVDFFP